MADSKDTKEQDIQDLVLARLKSIPSGVELAIGDLGAFTINELEQHIRDNDEIGRMYIETQLSYLRSLGDLPFDDENISHN